MGIGPNRLGVDMAKLIRRWLMPLILYTVFVIILFVVFRNRAITDATELVNNNLIQSAQSDVTTIMKPLNDARLSAAPMIELLGQVDSTDEESVDLLADALSNSIKTYLLVVEYPGGDGTVYSEDETYDGQVIPVSEFDYVMRALASTSPQYLYAEDDLITGTKATVLMIPFRFRDNELGHLLIYDDLNAFLGRIDVAVSGRKTITLIDSDGSILISGTGSEALTRSDNLKSAVQSMGARLDLSQTGRLKNSVIDISPDKAGGYKLIQVPFGMNGWVLVNIYNSALVDVLVDRQLGTTLSFAGGLLISIFIFFGIIIIITLISKFQERKNAKKLEEKADTDQLTGLLNKKATERSIQEVMDAAPGQSGLMFVVDIDDFKHCNDNYGHAYGDEVLSELGRHLSGMYRASDLVGRIGGDEFMIFLRNVPEDPELINQMAEKLVELSHNFQPGSITRHKVTLSIGAARFPSDGEDFASLYKAADRALYTSKQNGKACLNFYQQA